VELAKIHYFHLASLQLRSLSRWV